jgi:heme/copper-type cytochrome/quinol oxidase subunit 4
MSDRIWTRIAAAGGIGDWEGRFPHRKKVKGQVMTVGADIPWFRFLSRWALFTGLVNLGNLLLSIVLFVPGPQASPLPEEYGELVVAISNPALFRLQLDIEIVGWLSLVVFFIAFAAILLPRAPIRGTLLAACGIGQIVGVLGAFIRLEGIPGVAERYMQANQLDRAAVLSSYRDLQAVITSHFSAGILLWSVAFLLVAWVGLARRDFPRWLVVLFGLTGVLGMIVTILYFLTSNEEGQVYILVGVLDALLVVIVFFAVAWTFWRGPRSRNRREASSQVR